MIPGHGGASHADPTAPVRYLPFAVRGNRPGKQVQLQEYEIKFLCTKAREIFINQPILLELEAPIKICGTRAVVSRVSVGLLGRAILMHRLVRTCR